MRVRPAHVLTHDNSSAVLDKFLAWGGRRVRDPRQPVIVLDHDIQNESPENLAKYARIETFAREQGIRFFPKGRGIGHQVVVEEGFARPGTFVVAADSHANLYGGVGALGTPVGRADAAAIWATGTTWWEIPEVVRVRLEGRLGAGSTPKDLILALLGAARRVASGRAVEFEGPGVDSISISGRLTIANMTTEWGAVAGVFPNEGLAGDAEASCAAHITVDLASITPTVTGPNDVAAARALPEVEALRIPIQKAYLLSCVNARLEDLEAAAAVLRGQRIAPGVEMYLAAASADVERDAVRSGAWKDLLDAGAIPLPSGCGPCIGLGRGVLRAGETGISATNRNFVGRMGDASAQCYLASPAVVAASALAGYISGPARQGAFAPPSRPRIDVVESPPRADSAAAPSPAAALADFEGELVCISRDDLDTDGIWPSTLTYRDSVSAEEMARHVFRHAIPEFATVARPGDLLVVGRDFGLGSSREQAVLAIRAFGIPIVIAASANATFKRNAFNNGYPVVECPELAAHLFARNLSDRGAAHIVRTGLFARVDLAGGFIHVGGESFPFAPLSNLARELLARGGLEAIVRTELAR